ncbi:hypothetical protein N402_05760 [Helicobacter pylori FD423]|nr:hypothetical protein N402_05760 [Helicobacter pylori FD423]
MNKLKFLKNGIFKTHKRIGGILKNSPQNPHNPIKTLYEELC